MLSAILLAAGSSRRMGPVNKLLLPYQGQPIVVATATRLLAAGLEEVIVVTGHERAAVTTALAHLPVRFAHNPHPEEGLTGSIRAGIRAAGTHPTASHAARIDTPASPASGTLGYMICLADLVLITAPEYAFLKKAFEEGVTSDDRCILIPEYNGQPGNPVIFSAAWREALLLHPEKEGCKSLVRSNGPHLLRVALSTDHILKDIDFPADYQALDGKA